TAQAIVDMIIPRAMGDDQPKTGLGEWPRRSDELERAREAILARLDRAEGTPKEALAHIRPESPSDPLERSVGLFFLVVASAVVIWFVFGFWRGSSARD